MMEKPKLGLVDVQPVVDDGIVKWLRLVYNVENNFGDIIQITFPKVVVPFSIYDEEIERYGDRRYLLSSDEVEILPVRGCFSTREIIWTKPPEEMTLKEIEAALGHPVKIVAEKEVEE